MLNTFTPAVLSSSLSVQSKFDLLNRLATSGYGSIGPNFGATNLDSTPSSGGNAGYTSQGSVTHIPTPTPTKYYATADGKTTPSSGVNTTQSGDVDPTLNRLLAEYANQFGGNTAERTSGTPVVVVPQGAGSDTGSATPSVAPKLLILLALAGIGYLGYRWYKNRGA